MPIKPENLNRYPRNWQKIRVRILDRAGHQCEWCGVANHSMRGTTRIVLTIAHLDHTPENCEFSNLRALCQKCHLDYDRERHLANGRATRARAKDERRPLLIEEGPR